MSTVQQYFRSDSTILGMIFGATFYFAYGLSLSSFNNNYLLAISILLSVILPFFSRTSNKIEEIINFKTGIITSGRIGRFFFQLVFNLILLGLLSYFKILKNGIHLRPMVLIQFALLTTLLSQGAQYIAIGFANREIGNKTRNVILAMVFSTSITAFSFMGLSLFKSIFIFISSLLGGGLFLLGFLSDLRSKLNPKNGIGIFFGTFNPFHKTHLKLIEDAIRERNLTHVYIHPTVIPKLHRDAINSGQIEIAHREMGMRVYKKTNKADIHVNYFPTGNKFFEFQTRCQLAELSILESNLRTKVTVLRLPELYEAKGFYGIISHIRKLHQNQPLHGIHGSDLGGMWVRSIYDESGWIYPFAVRRIDSVSATAIRNGARNQTTHLVEHILYHFRKNDSCFQIDNRSFRFFEGDLSYETIKS